MNSRQRSLSMTSRNKTKKTNKQRIFKQHLQKFRVSIRGFLRNASTDLSKTRCSSFSTSSTSWHNKPRLATSTHRQVLRLDAQHGFKSPVNCQRLIFSPKSASWLSLNLFQPFLNASFLLALDDSPQLLENDGLILNCNNTVERHSSIHIISAVNQITVNIDNYDLVMSLPPQASICSVN